MLKSLPTQLFATIIFGPLGLAYTSMAAAVFLTLILAVLFFTELSIVAFVIVWPMAIAVGVIFVQMHNQQVKAAGGRLLLGPDDNEEEIVSAFGSWGRGAAVLAGLAAVAYFTFGNGIDQDSFGRLAATYSQSESDTKSVSADPAGSASVTEAADTELPVAQTFSIESDTDESQTENQSASYTQSAGIPASGAEQVADTSESGVDTAGSSSVTETADTELPVAQTFSIESDTDASQTESGFSVITFEERVLQPVVIGTSSPPVLPAGNRLYVDTTLVNLREGPGTSFGIVTTVGRGIELAEIDRSGSWIEVIASDSGTRGWIFNSLVSTEP